MIYKQQTIRARLPSCSYTYDQLVSLIEFCKTIHHECKERVKLEILSGRFLLADLENPTPEQTESFLNKYYSSVAEFRGANGEYVSIHDIENLLPTDLPSKILSFRFENSFFFEFSLKRKPSTYFEISIDFNDKKALDLISSPSLATTDLNYIEVVGMDHTFVVGLTSRFLDWFEKYKNLSSIIHRQNVYDISLWCFYCPAILVYLVKFYEKLPHSLFVLPIFVQVLFGIVFFMFFLLVFRLLFALGRWFFPCQELRTQRNKFREFSKYIFIVAITGVIGTIGVNVSTWLWGKFSI